MKDEAKISLDNSTDRDALARLLISVLQFEAVLDGFNLGLMGQALGEEVGCVVDYLRKRIEYLDSPPVPTAYPSLASERRRRLTELNAKFFEQGYLTQADADARRALLEWAAAEYLRASQEADDQPTWEWVKVDDYWSRMMFLAVKRRSATEEAEYQKLWRLAVSEGRIHEAP